MLAGVAEAGGDCLGPDLLLQLRGTRELMVSCVQVRKLFVDQKAGIEVFAKQAT